MKRNNKNEEVPARTNRYDGYTNTARKNAKSDSNKDK